MHSGKNASICNFITWMRLLSITPAVKFLTVEILYTFCPSMPILILYHHWKYKTIPFVFRFCFWGGGCSSERWRLSYAHLWKKSSMMVFFSVGSTVHFLIRAMTFKKSENKQNELQTSTKWLENEHVNRRQKWTCWLQYYFPILCGFRPAHFRVLQSCVIVQKNWNVAFFFILVTCDAITWRKYNKQRFPVYQCLAFCYKTSFSLELFCYKLD